MYVMVSGPPGSGKSTLAQPIAVQLDLPLIAKDAIKEALMDVLGYPTSVEQSRILGRAAVMAMLNVAASSQAGAVLDSTFFPYSLHIVVDTTTAVDVGEVVREIRRLAAPDRSSGEASSRRLT